MTVHIICALQCEARPLISYYGLRKLEQTNTFTVYTKQDSGLSLTVTGIGKINSADGTGFTGGLLNTTSNSAWLNIGIAGHALLEIGTAVLVNKIKDKHNGIDWYPQFIFKIPCTTGPLQTLDCPSTEYSNDMYDMEAAGFYAAARRFSSCELVHSLKIISDNAEHPAKQMNESVISELVSGQIKIVDQIISELDSLSDELNSVYKSPEYYNDCINRWHFSQTERIQLSRLLQRWSVLCSGNCPLNKLETIPRGEQVLRYLENTLDAIPVKFTDQALFD